MAKFTSTKTTVRVIKPGASAIAQLAAAMAPGTWAQLNSGGLQLFASPDGEGAGGIRNAYATKLAFDPDGLKTYFIGDDHDAPIHFFIYDDTTNTWTEGPKVPWSPGVGSADHGYEHTVWVPTVKKLFRRRHRGMELWRWDGGSTWSSFPLTPGLNYYSAASGISWFPEVGKIIVFQVENGTNGALVGYDPVTGAQTIYVSGASNVLANTGDPHNFCHYNPSQKIIWFGGGNGATSNWKMDANGKITKLADIPPALGDIGPGNGQSLPVYNPVSGKFLVFKNSSVRYELDPAGSGTWKPLSGTNQAWVTSYDPTEPVYGTQGCPRPDLGVILFLKGVGRNTPAQMWVYKP